MARQAHYEEISEVDIVDTSSFVQAVVTVLSLINPVICGTLFAEAVHGNDKPSEIKEATKAALAIFVILSASAIAGASVLGAFGISLDAFQFAGGIVLGWMGFSMLRGAKSHRAAHEPAGNSDSAITPLILFAASPGTITGVITIAVSNGSSGLPVAALVGVTVAIAVTWGLMLLAARSGPKQGGLMHDVTTRFMGLIVLAMGMQFALTGYQAFMSGT